MARGRDLRFVGDVHFRARRAEREGLVGGISAGGRRGGQLRSRVLRGSRGNRAARRHHDDDARSRSVAGGRRRSPPRVDHESRQPRARSRGDLVCGNRAGDRGVRQRASGVLEDVRADGVRRRGRRDSGHAAAALARPTCRSGRRIWRWPKASRSARLQFETDRARFLGRGRDVRDAVSAIDGRPLSDTVGTVLDPIFSVRRRLRIPAGATARVAFWTIVAPTRAEVIDLVDKHHDSSAFERAVTLAWTQAQVQLHHLRVDADEAHLFQRIANRVIYSDPTLRPSSDLLQRGEGGQSKLWPAGISGDLPIVLVRIDDTDDLEIVRELVRAHEYWRMKRLCVDLVIVNERPPSYHQELQAALEGLVRTSPARSPADGQAACGNIFVLRADLVSAELRSVLQTVARAVLLSRRGTLSEQVKRLGDVRARGSAAASASPRDTACGVVDAATRGRVFQRAWRICRGRP